MRPRHARYTGAVLLSAVLLAVCPARADTKTNRADFKISGFGFLGNRQLKRVVHLLEKGRPEFYDPAFVEDGAVLIMGTLRREGFLEPQITARLTLEDGSRVEYQWTRPTREPLPRALRIAAVRFKVHEGVRYHYRAVRFEGLRALKEKEAKRFFVETGVIVPLQGQRIYTPEKLKGSLRDLQETLQRKGFRDAAVDAASVSQDPRKGRVDVTIRIVEGSRYFIRSITKDVATPTNVVTSTVATNAIYSAAWVQDFKQSLQQSYYQQGFPDAAANIRTTNETIMGDMTELEVVARVSRGPAVTLNDVRFEGARKSNEDFLAGRINLREGEPLDRLKVERARVRLSRLGVFDSVGVRYDLASTNSRDVVYLLDEGKQFDVSLLAGWGSYELLRGGVQTEAFNLFGRAHHARLRLAQSFKASSVNFVYTMPELLGENLNVFLTAHALRREEVSFIREEYGGGAGLQKRLSGISSDASLRYEYEVLNAAEADVEVPLEGVRSANVGAVIGELQHDRRDNPLYPRKGYKVFSRFEIGADYFGGDANYQRFETASALHIPLHEGGWLHLGVSHGVVLSAGARAEDLPFNRRFFPGGESSIRGYQEGEASPRDAEGKFVGAETFVLGNLEIEQALTRAFSFIAFVDGLGFARNVSDYPASTGLVSVGGGLRWKTIVGPIRIEYGHNINPREDDPSGTIHFSLGFPF
jgi:outer membrane protein insertion porin family